MPLTDRYTTLLFDLDGTLTDPKIGITQSVHYALRKMGIKNVDVESLTRFIGPPLKESFKKYYGFDDEQTDLGIRYYREYFSETGIYENTLYLGIDGLLKALAKKGLRQIIATTKPTVYAKRICDHFVISRYFIDIKGSELDGTLSDKGELIGHILRKHGVDNEKALMIGDREHDIIGARSNAVKSVGVGYGYGGRRELEASGATYYAATVGELTRLLCE